MNTKELLEFLGHEATEELIEKVDFHFLISRKTPKGATMEKVFSYIAQKHRVPYEKLFEQSKVRVVIKPRQEAVFLCRMLGFKFVELGKFLKQDHSTIIYCVNTIKDAIYLNSTYKKELQDDLAFLTI